MMSIIPCKHSEHDYIIRIDNIMQCRLCGKIGGEVMEVITTVQSLKQARRIQDEIVQFGGWEVVNRNKYSVVYSRVYSRNNNDITEELKVERKGIRRWDVVNVIRQEEGR